MKGKIESNVAEFNAKLARLKRIDIEAADYVLTKIVMGLFADLVRNTPIVSGTLQHGWQPPRKLAPTLWEISNTTKYVVFVEYGVKGHPLSSDPVKRKRSLRYLFATGILVNENGAIIYNYTPKKQSVGFIRRTLREWEQKAPTLLRRYLKEWVLKKLEAIP